MNFAGITLTATALALASWSAALADPGHHHHNRTAETSYGRPGAPSRAARTIDVAMRETDVGMAFVPNRIEVARGEQVRFLLRNEGELEHELVIGTAEANRAHAEAMKANPEMAHEDPNARRLDSKTSGSLLWQFTRAGSFEYACLIPGHREAGMVGLISVR